nr:MAG TPA: hypothetical protein [Caudoviricetes sp.]
MYSMMRVIASRRLVLSISIVITVFSIVVWLLYCYLFVNTPPIIGREEHSSLALIFEKLVSFELCHRLHIYHPVGVMTEVVVCCEPAVVIFCYFVAIIRVLKQSIPTFVNLVGIIHERLESRCQVAGLRISRSLGLHQLTTCHLVKHLAVYLEHWANLTGDEELKAGDGEHVNLCRATSLLVFRILAQNLGVLRIFAQNLIINVFNE